MGELGLRPDGEAPLRLAQAHPQVFVTDFARALSFYERQLGFRVSFAYGRPPFYGLVERQGARLNLRHVDRAPLDPVLRDRERLLSAYIPVQGIEQLFAEFEQGGILFVQRLQRKPWGTRDFILCDPDGNLLCFAEDA